MALIRTLWAVVVATLVLPVVLAQNDRPVYGDDSSGQRFSPLKQINFGELSGGCEAWPTGQVMPGFNPFNEFKSAVAPGARLTRGLA